VEAGKICLEEWRSCGNQGQPFIVGRRLVVSKKNLNVKLLESALVTRTAKEEVERPKDG
jgi:hypothetical protein